MQDVHLFGWGNSVRGAPMPWIYKDAELIQQVVALAPFIENT